MDFLQRMQQNTPYCSRHTDMPTRLQQKAKTLCWQYNQTGPHQQQERAQLLQELLGSCHPLTFIEPSFWTPLRSTSEPTPLSRRASVLPVRDTRSTHSSAQRESAPQRLSHWRKMCGLEQTAWSAAG